MKKYIIILSAICGTLLIGCQNNSDLEERVEILEKKVDKLTGTSGNNVGGANNLSAQDLVSNPATINNPNAELQMDGPVAGIAFTEETYDFGTITAGDKVNHTFRFTNTGENPLIISNAKGSCGCTVPNWPREPIAPGASGEIFVEFNSAGKVGQQKKSVTITANTNPATTQVFITSNVLKAEGDGSSPAPAIQPAQ